MRWTKDFFWAAQNAWHRKDWRSLLITACLVQSVFGSLALYKADKPLATEESLSIFGVPAVLVVGILALHCLPHRGHLVLLLTLASVFACRFITYVLFTVLCHADDSVRQHCAAKRASVAQPPIVAIVVGTLSTQLPWAHVFPIVLGSCAIFLGWSLVPFVACQSHQFAVVSSLCSTTGTPWHNQEVLHVATGVVFCLAAFIFCAHVSDSISKREEAIFVHLQDHFAVQAKVLTETSTTYVDRAVLGQFCAISPFGFMALEEDHVGHGRISTKDFFERYVNKVAVTSFHDAPQDAEHHFQKWRRGEAIKRLRMSGPFLTVAVGSLVLLHSWVAWEAYTSTSSLWSLCAASQAAGVLAALISAVCLKFVPARGSRSGLSCIPIQGVGVVLGQLLFTVPFASCIGLCCAAGPTDPAWPECSKGLGGLPSAPFQLLVLLLHALWLGGPRALAVIDVVLFILHGASMMQRHLQHEALPRIIFQNLITVAVCIRAAFMVERCDRLFWLLSQAASLGHASLDAEGSQVDILDAELSVVSVAKAYSPEASYYITCCMPGCKPHAGLWTIRDLQSSFLRAQVHGVATSPCFDRSLCLLDGLGANLQREAEARLKRTLTYHLSSAGPAARVLRLDRPHLTPRLRVLILCVGGNGDVQAMLAVARALAKDGHICRFATHSAFQDVVQASGLEFYPLATAQEGHWDPPLLLDHLRLKRGVGDFLVRPRDHLEILGDDPESAFILKQILQPVQPANTDQWSPVIGPWAAATQAGATGGRRFVAEAIVANPWAVAHIHLAERLGIPCHLVDTVPWEPTEVRGHPLGRPVERESGAEDQRWASYWQQLPFRWHEDARGAYVLGPRSTTMNGLRPCSMKASILTFRDAIGLPAMEFQEQPAPDFLELQVPFMCLHSPSLLVDRPPDWGPHIDICGYPDDGSAAAQASRPQALERFLKAGQAPLYVGFGSVDADLARVAEALVHIAVDIGLRVVLQRGTRSFGPLLATLPATVFYIGHGSDATSEAFQALVSKGLACHGPVDHEWLFTQCRALCHHGSSGMLHRGIRLGKPALVIGFMRGQPLWGGLLQHHGAGRLVASWKARKNLVTEALMYVLSDEATKCAASLQQLLRREREDRGDPAQCAVDAFHRHLPLNLLNCDVCMQMSACREQCDQKHSHHRFVRAATVYHAGSRLKLCGVCCYAASVHGSSYHAISGGGDGEASSPKQWNLAAYRPLDWGLARRKQEDAAGGAAVPFSSLEGGGLVGPPLETWEALVSHLLCMDGVSLKGGGAAAAVALAQGPAGLELRPRDQQASAADASAASVQLLTQSEEDAICADIATAFSAEVVAREQRAKVQTSASAVFAMELARARALHSTNSGLRRPRSSALEGESGRTSMRSNTMRDQLLPTSS